MTISNTKKKIIVITGPTASGKTELSLHIAQKFNAEIINADSVQIYKKYDIGSAKITIDEQKNIKHHLIDIIEPNQNYSIYNFQKDCRKIIQNINLPILVGGSGLYIKSALFNYELNPINNDLSKYKKNFNQNELQEMLKKIHQKDPDLILDQKNPRRIINAFIDLKSNKLRSQKKQKNKPIFDILTIYLDIDRKILKERVIKRLNKMIKIGFIEETKEILKKFSNSNLDNIIGYREIKNFLEKKISLEEAKKLIIAKTMQYAKRQKTWFKNQMPIRIINALDIELIPKTYHIIEKFLKDIPK